jgi:TolA-binding protein
MKLLLILTFVSALILPSCSLFQRDMEELEAMESGEPPFDPRESKESLEGHLNPEIPDSTTVASSGADAEISRLQTKISALETKVDVLTANLEKIQLQKAQPIIEASTNPEPNLAAPVATESQFQNEDNAMVSSAPTRPAMAASTQLPDAVKTVNSTGAERDFRAAMDLFQSGKNMEASMRFSMVAKKFSRHLLAGHALYWAGESAARAKQWSVALENWDALEKNYPRSTYLPDALAGLAKAYEAQGDAAQAKTYRETLKRSFPNSPVVLSLQMRTEHKVNRPQVPVTEEPVPEFSESAEEEVSE